MVLFDSKEARRAIEDLEDQMIRMNKQTDYGLLLLFQFVRPENRGKNLTAVGLADATHLPVPIVGKVLKRLAKHGVLRSYRGPSGGYRLSRDPTRLSLAEIVGVLEGPLAITDCLDEENGCRREDVCPMRGKWEQINSAMFAVFAGISLEELAGKCAEDLISF